MFENRIKKLRKIKNLSRVKEGRKNGFSLLIFKMRSQRVRYMELFRVRLRN